MSQDLTQFRNLFDESSQKYLKVLEEGITILKNRGSQNKSAIDNIYRSAHSLRGESAIMEHPQTATLSSIIEKIFYMVLEEKLKITDDLLLALSEALKHLEESLKSIHNTNQETNLDEDIKKLQEGTGISLESSK